MSARSGNKGGDNRRIQTTLNPRNIQSTLDVEGVSTQGDVLGLLSLQLQTWATTWQAACLGGWGAHELGGLNLPWRLCGSSQTGKCHLTGENTTPGEQGLSYNHIRCYQEAAPHFGARALRSKSWLCHLPAGCLGEACLTFLSPREMGIVTDPTSQSDGRGK